jgi:hypothetical protein
MPHVSDPTFLVLHALRVKGFAKVEALAELIDRPVAAVEPQLCEFSLAGLAAFREQRALWQLTPAGKDAHAVALASDLVGAPLHEVKAVYPDFLELNDEFKALCGEWQLRDGQVNDHTDSRYDAAMVARLVAHDAKVQPVCAAFGSAIGRYEPYGSRLGAVACRVGSGERNLFTGVLCGSYHDIWMELHEDLIVTLGIDRAKEGSF